MSEKNNVFSETSQTTPSDLIKRPSLIENHLVKFWLSETIMKNMDKSNYPRIMFIFSIVFFFLGRDLKIYTNLFIGITIYMLIIRAIRFYVKRWLLYFCEFCYFGISGLILYLAYFQNNKIAWTIVYSYGTGNMALAVIILNNQALFTSSDHMASAWLHSAPLITCWAIRWRHIIYDKQIEGFISVENMNLNPTEAIYHLGLYPIIFWTCWAVFYTFLMNVVFGKYYSDPKYENCVNDFVGLVEKNKLVSKIVKNPRSNTHPKYLLNHFTQFAIGLVISNICYVNFYVNTFYVCLIIFYLFWSAGKSQQRYLEKKVTKTLVKAEASNLEEKKQN
jgi:hypothetical protein